MSPAPALTGALMLYPQEIRNYRDWISDGSRYCGDARFVSGHGLASPVRYLIRRDVRTLTTARSIHLPSRAETAFGLSVNLTQANRPASSYCAIKGTLNRILWPSRFFGDISSSPGAARGVAAP